MKYVQIRGGKKCFITFVDDCTKYCYLYLLRSKDKAIEAFKDFKTEVKNQLSSHIKMVQSDSAGEYIPFEELYN